MQKQEEINNFDLQVRQLLENAEERSPRGAWKAIDSRLSGPARRPSFNWAWCGASLAFAAALAAGLFLSGTFNAPETPSAKSTYLAEAPHSSLEEIAAEPVGASEKAFGGAIPAESAAPAVSAAKTPSSVQSGQNSESIRATAIMSSGEAAARQILDEVSRNTAEKKEKKAQKEPQAPAADPFVQMEFEERMAQAAKKQKPSIYAGGTLAGNNAQSSGTWMGVSGASSGSLTRTGNENFGIPFSVGAGVKFPLGGRFFLGAGLNWSMLSSSFEGTYQGASGDISHKMHYIGIPVNVYFDIYSSRIFKVYAHAGAEAEYCVSNRYFFHSSASSTDISEAVKGLQYSVGAGLGLEFNVTEHLGIYLDPSFRNYFPSGHPDNIRTSNPQMFNFEAGVRFNFD